MNPSQWGQKAIVSAYKALKVPLFEPISHFSKRNEAQKRNQSKMCGETFHTKNAKTIFVRTL